MSSNAKNLDAVGQVASSDETSIVDFNGLIAAVLNQDEFSAFEIDNPEPGYISISNSQVTIVLIDKSVWQAWSSTKTRPLR